MKKVINILFLLLTLTAFVSCGRIADTIPPSQENSGFVDNAPGTTQVEVKAIYPSDESTFVSRSSDIVVVFSKPVNTATVIANTNVVLSGVTLNAPSFSADNSIATFTHAVLANSTAYTVTVNTSGIIAADGGTAASYTDPVLPSGHHFTTIDSDTETTNRVPVVLSDTRYPSNISTATLPVDYVQLTFSEEMNFGTVSFTVTNATGGAVSSTDNKTFVLPITGVDYGETITVTVNAGAQSSAGVGLDYNGDHTWFFYIEADPYTTAGTVTIGSVWVTNVTNNAATINWTTSKTVTVSSAYYDTDSNIASGGLPQADLSPASTYHYANLSGLSSATRYYFNVTSDGVTSATGYFVTKGVAGTNIPLSTEAGNKTNLSAIRNTDQLGVYNGSSFVVWENGAEIKAAYFDSDAAGSFLWGGLNGTVVDSSSMSNSRAYSDLRGGLLVSMESGGYIYVKRVYNNAGTMTFGGGGWGTGAATTGKQLSLDGANPHMSIVWNNPANNNVDGNSFTVQRSGTAVVLPAGNWFYDFDTNFSGTTPVVSAGNIILDVTGTQTITTVATDSSAYRHALDQSSAVIAANEAFVVGNHLSTSSFIARDHAMFSAGTLSNGTTTVYTEHGYTLFGSISANDIIYNANTLLGGRYTANLQINNNTALETGSANAIRANHLINGQTDFTTFGIVVNDEYYARNIKSASAFFNRYSLITDISATKTDLTLAADIFPDGDEDYEIIKVGSILLAWGTATFGTGGVYLVDTGNWFSGGISAGDVVVNNTTGQITFILTVAGNVLTLDDPIFSSGNSYSIYTGTSLIAGTAGAVKANHLIDGNAVSGSLGSTGFNALTYSYTLYAVNDSNRLYAPVTGITEIDLTLGDDIFTAAGQAYYLFDIDTGSLLASGTNSSVAANKLVDSSNDFSSIASGSYVMNTTDKTITTITTVIAYILGLDDDIFVSGDSYSLQTGSGSLASGVLENVGFSDLTDNDVADFGAIGLIPGSAYVRNTVTGRYATILSWSGNTITVSSTVMFNTTDGYEVFNLTAVAATGVADGTSTGQLVHSAANFISIATGTASYALRTNPTPMKATRINNVIATELQLNNNIFTAASKSYQIYSGTSPYSGGVSSVRVNYLIDAGYDFTTLVSLGVGDFVRNTTNFNYTTVKTFPPVAADKDQLELDAHIFTANNEGYELIDKGALIMSGVNTGSTASQVVDGGMYFPGIITPADFVVINTTNNRMARIVSVSDDTLELDASIFTTGDSYSIYSGSLLHTGQAQALKTMSLIDGSKTSWSSTYIGYFVRISAALYAKVTAAVPTELTLNADIFTLGTEGYSIYSEYCDTHYGANSLTPFYRFTLNAADPINTSDGDSITIYDNIVQGTADTPPTNPLYDNDITLNFTTVTANNDYAFNFTSGNIAQVNAVTYTRGIGLDSDIFTVAGTHLYSIVRTSPYIAPGYVLDNGLVSSVSGSQIVIADTSGIEKGDLVYNVTDNTYAVVMSNDDATHLTLNRAIFAATEGYMVFASNDRLTETGINTTSGATLTDANADFTTSGVSIGDIARNNNTGAQSLITSVAANTLGLADATAFASTNQRYVILQPKVFVAFEHVNGGFNEIYGQYLRLRDGSATGSAFAIYIGAIASNIQTAPDAGGNSFVFYEVGVNIYAKKFNAAGTELISSYASTDPGFSITLSGTLIKVLPDGAGGVYILYEDSGNVYLQRMSSTLANVWTGGAVTVAAAARDSAMILDSANRPIVAYSESGTGHIRITKYPVFSGVAPTALYAGMPVNVLTIGTYGTFYYNSDDHKSNISLTTDGTTGVVVSWVDTRYMSSLGFTIHALGLDSGGNPVAAWNANAGGLATDYNGVMVGITGSVLESDIGHASVNYNDGAGAWSARFIWQDFRNSISDLYYQSFAY